MMTNDETGVVPLLKHDPAVATSVELMRIGSAIELIAAVLRGYPDRHAEVWRSSEWSKDLKDLELAVIRLRRCARELEKMAEHIRYGERPAAQ